MEIKKKSNKQEKSISIEDLPMENLTDEEMAKVNGGSMFTFLNPRVYDASQMFTYDPLYMFANM
jgi:bacteriocin-like protein